MKLRNEIKKFNAPDRPGWGSKADWPKGPWDDEPDKMQWIDDATGLDCLIVRNGSGALCGYVGVPEGHSWFGVNYDNCEMPNDQYGPDVHGGLTFSDFCTSERMNSTATDEQMAWAKEWGICHVPEPGRPDRVWWLGFDCAHAGDLTPSMEALRIKMHRQKPDEVCWQPRATGGDTYRDLGYVMGEVASLAAAAMIALKADPEAFEKLRVDKVAQEELRGL